MNVIRFKVIDKCFQKASRYSDADFDFYLEKDDWNDYGFCTTYHLHTAKGLTPKGNQYIGPISIMKKGQKKGEKYVLPAKEFESLPGNFCSVSLSVDFYRNLIDVLQYDDRYLFRNSLRLVMGQDSPLYMDFKDEPCFINSLLRDATIDNDILKMGNWYLFGVGSVYNLLSKPLKIKLNNILEPFELNFSPLSENIPSNICVFVGNNGSGKSTALYKIAKLLYASPKDRTSLSEKIGKIIEPSDVGFSRLIMMSFSAFDNFVLPGLSLGGDYQLIKDGMERFDGRFIFCGIRDVKREFNELLEEKREKVEDKSERQDIIHLKDVNSLSEEFVKALEKISSDSERTKLWYNFVDEVAKKQSLLMVDLEPFKRVDSIEVMLGYSEWTKKFRTLCTGHKFLLHSLAHLIACCEKNSMVIFDEPENHLHPPLLSFMIAEMRVVLNKFSSTMLIATHSPVILQETFSRNIRVFRRNGGSCSVSMPKIETYGENLGTIISEVFDLTTDNTQYYECFDKLYNTFECKYLRDSQAVIKEFEDILGCSLSNQMAAYLIGKKIKDDIE
jgi:ABC-type lipoprotein export system ATPase subunit